MKPELTVTLPNKRRAEGREDGVEKIPIKGGVVSVSRALEVLLEHERDRNIPLVLKRDLAASITHWLGAQDHRPPFVDAASARRWKAVLAKEFGTDLNGELRIADHDVPFGRPRVAKFTFIDLFAGIGGFRLALQAVGGRSVFSSEWDEKAKETYFSNFGEVPYGDIRAFTADTIPDRDLARLIPNHDVLAAGFPCQPFSLAGVSARNSLGQDHGFSCEIQGTLFFDLMRIAKVKRPRVLLLENVKNLRSHDAGRTFDKIRRTIEEDLGYSFNSAVLDSASLVPQRRRRCYMVCFRDGSSFDFPDLSGEPLALASALEVNVDDSYTLSDRMWQGHVNRTKRNRDRGVGFSANTADLSRPSNTLVARYYKDGKECLVPQEGKNPRMLTPRECANLQGFPKTFKVHPTRSHAYRQFGNSVAVPVIDRIARAIVGQLGCE